MVSNHYREDHKLIFRVRHCMGIFCLILYVLGIFHVLLGVQSPGKIEILLIFCLSFYLMLNLISVVHLWVADVKVYLNCSHRMIRDQVGF